MRLFLFIAGISVFSVLIEKPVEARDYPWCAQYGPTTRNCGFMTFQQCLATISGIGGSCVPNYMYQPPSGPHPSKKPRTPGLY
jgi:Protein of unknown function (DUF3551)